MAISLFVAFVLLCAGMSAVYVVFIYLLWVCTPGAGDNQLARLRGKPVAGKGLSASELEKLPKVTRKELVMGSECAICLDEIEGEQPVRMVPGCNHGFHLQCADAWLFRRSGCPLCRTKLDPQVFTASSNQNPSKIYFSSLGKNLCMLLVIRRRLFITIVRRKSFGIVSFGREE